MGEDVIKVTSGNHGIPGQLRFQHCFSGKTVTCKTSRKRNAVAMPMPRPRQRRRVETCEADPKAGGHSHAASSTHSRWTDPDGAIDGTSLVLFRTALAAGIVNDCITMAGNGEAHDFFAVPTRINFHYPWAPWIRPLSGLQWFSPHIMGASAMAFGTGLAPRLATYSLVAGYLFLCDSLATLIITTCTLSSRYSCCSSMRHARRGAERTGGRVPGRRARPSATGTFG